MGRKKVRLEYIQDENARKVTYKKRVKGVVKKTQELSVLCGVDACAVIYGPYDQAPVVWPSTEDAAKRILHNYKYKPEMDQSQRTLDQQKYLVQCVTKAEERLVRILRKNREMEMGYLTSDLLAGKPVDQIAVSDVPDLLWVIDDKLRSIQHRVNPPDPNAAAAATPTLNPFNIPQGSSSADNPPFLTANTAASQNLIPYNINIPQGSLATDNPSFQVANTGVSRNLNPYNIPHGSMAAHQYPSFQVANTGGGGRNLNAYNIPHGSMAADQNPSFPTANRGARHNRNAYNIAHGSTGGIDAHTLMGETAPWAMQPGPSMQAGPSMRNSR